jgi:hypothetical protein
MNRKDLLKIARELRALIGAHAKLIGRHAPQDVYLRAQADSDTATRSARYIAEHYTSRADIRAAFLRACGLDAEARAAQMNLPRILAL